MLESVEAMWKVSFMDREAVEGAVGCVGEADVGV